MLLTVRLRILAGLALMVAGCSLLTVELSTAGNADPCAAEDALCPNLQTVDPDSGTWLRVDRRGPKGKRRVKLSLSNRIGNRGSGPLELTSSDPSAGCIPAGGDAADYRDVEQRIYTDSNDDGVFDRGVDTESNLVPIGCYFFHAVHNHWHFQDFAEYELERLGGEPVGAGTKVGFCVLDQTQPFDPNPPGTPEDQYFSGSGCNDPSDPAAAMGLSIGYADLYGLATPGQEIDITGAGKGKFCLVATANPMPRIFEEELDGGAPGTSDNARRVKLQIKPRKEFVRELTAPC
jgi:hypothetical protein